MRLHAAAAMVKCLGAAVFAAVLGACSTTSPEAETASHGTLTTGAKFGTGIGRSATALPQTMWAQGYGFLGIETCTSRLTEQINCQAGDVVLAFQPVELGRAGRIWFRIDGDRITAIAWDLKYVAVAEG